MSEATALERAIALAVQSHRGQVDKGGQPYILHPLRVMLACKDEPDQIVAVLHDTVEDCGVELNLIAHHFGREVSSAVDALSRRDGETYLSFIERCAGNPIARRVKLKDIADNMDVTRLGREPNADDARRLRRYSNALSALWRASDMPKGGEQ